MKRIEEQLGRDLSRAVEGAGPAPSLGARSAMRIRVRQVFSIAAVSVAGVGVTVMAAWAASAMSGREGGPSVDVAQGQTARILVLDSGPDGDYVHGIITAADVSGGDIVVRHRFEAGTDPDFAIAPDGTRLFGVAHSPDGSGSLLRVFDVATGGVLDEERFEGWAGTTGLHVTRKMATSADGTYAFVLVGAPTGVGDLAQAITTYDADRQEMLPRTAPLDGCGGSPLLFGDAGRDLIVVCRETSQVLFVEISNSGAIGNVERLDVPRESHEAEGPTGPSNPFDVGAISGGSRAPDGSIYLATGDGRLYLVDPAAREIEEKGDLLPPESDEWISVPQLHLSADGRYLLAGLGSVSTGNGNTVRIEADDIAVFELTTLDLVQTIRGGTFWAFSPAPDGSIYMVDRSTGLLRVAQLRGNSGGQVIGHIGDVPSDIAVVPSG